MAHDIVILGVFVADATYRTARLPVMGETLLGSGFALGPGGKGSNQAVAAARAGGDVGFLTKLGDDAFADMAHETWRAAGVHPLVNRDPESYTGSACILVDETTGNNAIVISPGAAATLAGADIDAQADAVGSAKVFVTQLEQPMEAAFRGLELARAGGALTILNPAPGADLPAGMLALSDIVTPNETEAEVLTGVPVASIGDAAKATEALRAAGAGTAIVTLGENGVFFDDGTKTLHLPSISAGPVVETTGAGDAFNGALAVALAEGEAAADAVRFANAAAALSVTRPGAASSMPTRAEIDDLRSGSS